MRVSDVIFDYLAKKGVDTAFMVTGGQAMFLDDAVHQNRHITPIFTHHEQSAGMAAESYGRVKGIPGVAVVTAGPGAVNVMNGVVGAWTDSSPMIVLSGQAALKAVQYQETTKIRQFGVQGINIRPLVDSVTKYFITVDDPQKILYYIQKAYHIATTGRPGPVWLDVPLDIQGKEIKGKLIQFVPEKEKLNRQLSKQVAQTIALLKKSKRPILLIGHGLRIANALPDFEKALERLKIPVVTSRLGIDSIESNHPLYIGRPGTYGERSANFTVQNADVIISIGSRLATSMIGHNAPDFGKNAKKVVVDIDAKELNKPGPILDIKILSDAKLFLREFNKQIYKVPPLHFSDWVNQANLWKKKYPVVLPEYRKEKPINSYYFTQRLSKLSSAKDMVLVDTGGCFHVAAQSWKVKKGQRYITTGGISSMGYWVAGIGACMAYGKKQTLIITGDGSLQMNIQELATIKHNNLPIKIFIFNNNGYLLIRHTQKNFMEGRLMGESPATGVWCPDSMKIAKAYGIKGVKIDNLKTMDIKIKEVLAHKGPVICEIITPEWQLLIPRTASIKNPDGSMVSKPYEDMFPFLPPEEIEENMIAEINKKTKVKNETFITGE